MSKERCASGITLQTILLVGLLCLFWKGAAFAGVGHLTGASESFVADELLIQPRAGVAKGRLDQLFADCDASPLEEIKQLGVLRIKVPSQAVEKVRTALANNPLIQFAEYNFLAQLSLVPNDQYYASQWHLAKISAPKAWDLTFGSEAVPIAVVDSGVDPTHPDLSGKLLPGYNFLGKNTDTHDVQGHGTAVAGSAAAMSNNLAGVAGVAWQNPIMPLLVADSTGSATYSNIAQAVTYAADKGIKVINISIGGTSSSSTLQSAVNYAWNKGAVVVAAACNYSSSTPCYPAACSNVVAVSATDSSDAFASFSNYGNWVDVSAPGWGIYTTLNGGGYGGKSGTSFSSPITAGVIALIFSQNPSLTNADVVKILEENTDDLGAAGFDAYFGYGRVNAYRSVLAAGGSIPQQDLASPTVSVASPSNGSTVKGAVPVNVNASDNVGVSKVDLYIDGILFATDTSNPYSFSWDSTTHPGGIAVIKALAYDPSGNVGSSNEVSVYVDNALDTTPPSVVISSPSNGATLAMKVTITATASDDASVEQLSVYIDGSLMKSVSNQNSVTWNWNTNKTAAGAHEIRTVAKDPSGNTGEARITVYK
ncbi:S8 family serine peptidase [Desulforhabdus amnigena]|jgi:hypothetical protein|uniref:Peptidase S8 n=1 Tax=Desulforhabdus amnigena TaxID=40218 RepID=A0A9W6L907_9BACT|nr:S8 family serine peptidase [Desulforhabdus amnigena]NLJ27231.1 S8 family serine peptidase [Deltaproteobacteria bacterium]GLI35204.1 hypothetical protein DAMNIGENAA_26370 [Desulforhabdus amnigena]